MPAGRPPVFETVEAFENKVEEYFTGNQVPTISGLALYLGFESRQSFYDYEQREGFSYIVKKTRLRMESHYEGLLQSKNPTGSIFWLKNAGWKDNLTITNVDIDFKDAE